MQMQRAVAVGKLLGWRRGDVTDDALVPDGARGWVNGDQIEQAEQLGFLRRASPSSSVPPASGTCKVAA